MATHTAALHWSRKPDERFLDGRYNRAHEWAFDGGAVVPASSSPQVVRAPFSDPAAVDPEEALLAALASCQMLFFLDFAKRKGFIVDSYEDAATGMVSANPEGRLAMTEVVLRPHIVFSGEVRPTAAAAAALHHAAHEACYIANTVKSEIRIEAREEGLASG